MRRPLVVIAVLFGLGISIVSKVKVAFALTYSLSAVLLVLGLVCIRKKLLFDIILSCAVVCIGGLWLKNTYILPRRHIARLLGYKEYGPSLVKGFVESQPVKKVNRTEFTFVVQEIQRGNLAYLTCGKILVSVYPAQIFSCGEQLRMKGTLRRSFASGKARRTWREYLYRQGIFALMRVETPYAVMRLGPRGGSACKRFSLLLKDKMEQVFFRWMPPVPASIVDAMLLGEKRHIPVLVQRNMIKSGTIHILVVSGFNVGIVAFIITLLLKILCLPRALRCVLSIACLLVYCLMTGASTPVVRATVMAVFFMCGVWLKREPDILNSCSVAAMAILLCNPRQLFDASFQLSFASVIAIAFLYPKLKVLLRLDSLRIPLLRGIVEGLLVSLSAWIGTMGFIAYYFRIFSPVTVVANICIVPLATLITLSGFSVVGLGYLSPPLGQACAHTCEFLVVVLLRLNSFFITLPGACFFLQGKS